MLQWLEKHWKNTEKPCAHNYSKYGKATRLRTVMDDHNKQILCYLF